MDHDGRIATSHTVETTYRQEVRDRVRALAALPNATVQSVLNDMRGVFPTDALAELRALAVDLPFVRSARVPEPSPVPDLHPLDYEWYFLENISEATASIFDGVSGTVACLGAPTVARELVSRGKRAILIDNNPLVLPRIGKHPLLRVLLHNISMPLKLDATFEGVFFDAPWYPEYTALWLWQAVRLSRPGTQIAFSLFPELTRPSASSERTKLLSFAQRHGDVTVHKNLLCYHTPGFEAEILSRHDLSDLMSWRRSDLVEITLRGGTAKPPPYPPPVEDKWDAYVIGSQVVKLRYRGGGCKPWLLGPVSTITDFLAETVSRRAPYRKEIDLWTSKNRVARVGDRVVMGAILAELQQNGDLDTALNRYLPSHGFPPKSECALQIRAVLDLTE